MFNKYYQDELAYLRELGREFAEHNPEAAGWLAEPGVDPDVERLLEGFSFLTARIREKLDDELPEFTHALLQLFWPHYLRPIPSMTVVQFTPRAKQAGKPHTVPRGAELASVPVDDTSCVFRVAYDTPVAALSVEQVEVGPSSSPYVLLKVGMAKAASLGKLGLKRLRLHFTGTSAASRALYLAFTSYVDQVTARDAKGKEVTLTDVRVAPVGFGEEETLLPFPSNSFLGFRLMQEYFTFPAKFMFVDVHGVEPLAELSDGTFELRFRLSTLPHDMPPVTEANVLLNCAPAVNLFKHDADPIRLDSERVEYQVRPSGHPAHFETHSVDSVKGIRRSEPEPRLYRPFFKFFRADEEGALLYKTRLANALATQGTDLFVTFMEQGQPALFGDETISIELTCSNRHLPTSLGLGDVSRSTQSSPSGLEFKNVTPPTPPVRPPIEGDLFWSLLSHLSFNYLSILQPGALGELLRLYDFRARVDRQAERALTRKLEGLGAARGQPKLHVHRGATIRGMGVEVQVDEEKFGGEGEVYLFGCVLNEFLARYVTLNAFSQLTLRGKKYGEVHEWPPKTGARTIL